MRERPIVSVVIPVYNRENSLQKCINSVLAAVPLNSEIIIVDDGSTDGSLRIAQEAASRDTRIIVRTQPNSGWAGKPRNVGLSLASGKYVLFVDSDDGLTRDGLKPALAFADEADSDILLIKIVSEHRRLWDDVFEKTDRSPSLRKLVRSNFVMKIWRRSFLVETGLRFAEEPARLEDAVFCFRAYSLTDRIAVYADHVVYELDRFSTGTHLSRQSIDWAAYGDPVRGALDPLITASFEESDIQAAVTDFFSRVVLSRFNRRWTESAIPQRYELAELGFELADRYSGHIVVDHLLPQRRRILRSLWREDYLNVWRFARSKSRTSALSVRADAVHGNRLTLDVMCIGENGSFRPSEVDVAVVDAGDKATPPVMLAEGVRLNADGSAAISLSARKLMTGRSYFLRVNAGGATGDAYLMSSKTASNRAKGSIPFLSFVQFGTAGYKRLTVRRKGFIQAIKTAVKPQR